MPDDVRCMMSVSVYDYCRSCVRPVTLQNGRLQSDQDCAASLII